MMMNNPDLYREAGLFTKLDTIKCLKKFTIKNKWKANNARIIDIGCGDGSTTRNLVRKYIPGEFRIVGCDISEKMIDYANNHFSDDQLEFCILDITKGLPEHLKDSFAHALSFYTFHRIKQQEAAFSNTYELLADGGNCLLLFLGRYPVFEAFRILSRTEKWGPYLKDVDVFISPYHDSTDPVTEVEVLMKQAGFKNVVVEAHEYTYTYSDVTSFKNLVKSVQPFDALNEKWEEFMADFMDILQHKLKVDYQVIEASGFK